MEIAAIYESISSAYEVISSFKDRLNELSSSDFDSENPRLFLNLLLKLVDVLETRLFFVYLEKAKTLEDQLPTPEGLDDLRELERKVSLTLAIVGELSGFAKYASDAKSHTAPWGVISQFERLSRSIVSQSRVIVSPTWEYNYLYSPIDHDLKSLLNKFRALETELYEALIAILRDYPRFFNLSFPSIQVENVLQLADWAHELGHFVDNFEGEKATGNSRSFLSAEVISKKLRIQLSKDEWAYLKKQFFTEQQSNSQIDPLDEFEFRRAIIWNTVNVLRKWAREIFSDLFSVRLFGPAALFSLCDLALFYYQDIDASFDEDHPPMKHRIRLLLEELDRWSPPPRGKRRSSSRDWKDFLPSDERIALDKSISSLKNRIRVKDETSNRFPSQPEIGGSSLRMIINILEQRIDEVAAIVREEVDAYIKGQMENSPPKDCFLFSDDFMHIGEHLDLLKRFIPPILMNRHNDHASRNNVQLALHLNTGWFHWTAQRKYPSKAPPRHFQKIKDDRIGIERLVMKSIELLEAEQWYQTHRSFDFDLEPDSGIAHQLAEKKSLSAGVVGGGLGKDAILERLEPPFANNSIVLTPLLDRESQVGEASIDIRLGNEFIGTKHTRLHALDPANQGIGNQIANYQEKYYVPFGYPFVLHPSQFVLGCTLEYISLPKDISALVVGRSSWGRLGLIIATASKVDPGFNGVLTLELVNLGNVPIFVYPGSRIAQLVLYRVS